MENMDLGVLDLSTCPLNELPANAIQRSLALAQLSESLGYSRYWIAEHHEANSAHSAPEVLLGWLASQTKTIKLGAAGILLRYHDPYLVAQNFSLLADLYSNRIELGIARGSIGGEMKAYYAGTDVSSLRLQEKSLQLSRLLKANPQITVLRPPAPGLPVWMMGGRAGMEIASSSKMNFCLDCFYQSLPDDEIKSILSQYVGQFHERSLTGTPECAVAIAGICAESDEIAQRWYQKARDTGFPTHLVKPLLAASAERWREYLGEISSKWNVKRFIILVASLDPEVQQTSLRLLANIMNLHACRENNGVAALFSAPEAYSAL
jgi:luciferase family oxidoreductase group 1